MSKAWTPNQENKVACKDCKFYRSVGWVDPECVHPKVKTSYFDNVKGNRYFIVDCKHARSSFGSCTKGKYFEQRVSLAKIIISWVKGE